ncbi:TonB-dependent siderophore receptor [Rhizobium sp. LC145]|jgi:iron complex outermembrane recepter protein|uniref:TonB-dependent siderophore receptor n=1 Tax=Rhizobium sp. LC145 TaxID=1120688 RepID=UPI0006996B5D|nr:TonB-dependent siderophore receptor [Rhizobium sp. LC145]TKT57700.1 TonB-dependent siderophore receptor [Rhizobiaceae bacterium LC148]
MVRVASKGQHKNTNMHRFAAALFASAALLPFAALAQDTTPTVSRASQPAAASYSIPASSLSAALSAFGDRTNLQVLYPAALARGKQSPGVNGVMSREQALERLLAGTGLAYRIANPGTVTIHAPAGDVVTGSTGDGSTILPTIVVQGESAVGPVDGYVARVSSAGTKTDTPLIETPQAISVITADQMSNQGASSIASSLSYTPGVVSQSGAFSRAVDDFTIRGFNIATGNSGNLRDGLKYQSNVYDGGQEPYGIERIDIMRGAGSMLYGQLTPGGVVNAISKRPTDTPLHEVNVEYGSYDRKQISADFGGPVTDDGVLTYRLTGLVRNADNWVDETPDNKVYIAPALTFAPDDATSLTLLSTYTHFHTRFATPLLYQDVSRGNIPRDAFLGNDDFDRYNGDIFTIGYLFEHELDNGIKFRNNARYFKSDVQWDYMMGNIAPLSLTGGDLYRLASKRYERSYGVTADTSVEYSFDAAGAEHTLLAGFDYYRRSYDNDRYRGAGYSILDLDTGTVLTDPAINYRVNRGSDNLSNQYGIYLQDQIKFDDHWVLLLGARQDWSKSRSRSYQTGVVTEQNDDALTGRAGLVYLFDNGIAPYLSIAQSFEPQTGLDYATGEALKPNKGLQYEAGVRYQPDGSNLLLSAAVYELTQKNLTTADSSGLTYQYGEVRSRGVELEARAEFGNLGLIASYTYTDAKITENAMPAYIGEQISLVPKNAFALWADYKLDDLGLEGVTVGAGIRYIGETNLIDSRSDVPGYVLVDAMASFDLGAMNKDLEGATLKLNARNLFDKEFYTCVYSDGCRYGEPLTVTATLSYKW